MRMAWILSIPLLLTACEGRQIVAICAGFGDPAREITAVRHDDAGEMAVLRVDSASGEATVTRQMLETPRLPDLWRQAETSMRALRETEASPCGNDDRSTVTAVFADGSVMHRETSCVGNALYRVAGLVLNTVEEVEAVAEPEVVRMPVALVRAACEALS